jgi:hypothetical protein
MKFMIASHYEIDSKRKSPGADRSAPGLVSLYDDLLSYLDDAIRSTAR